MAEWHRTHGGGIDPRLLDILAEARTRTGLPFEISSGIRTPEEQRKLLEQGYSTTMRSYHLPQQGTNLAAATDLYLGGDFKSDEEILNAYRPIAEAAKQIAAEKGYDNFTWGGDWKSFFDPYHFQLGGKSNPAMSLSTKDAAMAPTMTPTAKQEEPQSLWDRLTGRSEATGLNPLEAFAAGLDALILPEMRMGDVIRQQGAQRAKTARTEKQANQTIKYLTGIGRDDLAKAVGTGAIDPASAIKVAITGTTEKDTALIRQALAAGLKQGTPEFQQYILSGGDIYSQETQLLASLPQPEKGMRYQFDRDENGKITNYRLVPIEGGSAAAEAEQLKVAEKVRKEDQLQKDYTFFGAGERVINAIDKDPTLIPKTGIIAGMIADTPFGQKQKDVAEDLAIMESQMQFETLADLKRASPTGASGLGQLTDAERRALGKIEQNFSNLQGEDAIKRTIRSASLMRTYMKNGIKDAKTGEYRNATDAEVEMMVQGINPFGPDSGAILEGLPSGIFPSGKPTQDGAPSQSTTKRMKFDSQGNMVN